MPELSYRAQLAEEIATFIREQDLCRVWGGDVHRIQNRRVYYEVGFSIPRILDGTVRLYGPGFIRIAFQTALADLPHEDTRIYNCVEDALAFLKAAFVDHDFEAAESVPARVREAE
jgi:hypothetical protein